jgi:hypothetical protein
MHVANNANDPKLHDILDDFQYAVNETMMGAAAKAQSALAKTEPKIQHLERTGN